jgi:glycerol-3-phosphate acyltransferase PlsX
VIEPPLRIAVDAMGGDQAPAQVVEGCLLAAAEGGVHLLLVGREAEVERELERLASGSGSLRSRIELVHADEVVAMDEPAVTPLRRKPGSSIRVCVELVKEERAQALVSAGNTGAAMAAVKVVLGTIPGVDRPALAAVLPNATGRTVLLDVGANVDTRPFHLREFAVMGHSYAREVLGTAVPRLGLLSIGEEENKGSELSRKVFRELQQTGLEFVGNVEGSDIFSGAVDVVVCDGFVGNAVLKSAEALADLATRMLREEIDASWRSRLGYVLARPAIDRFTERTDYAEYGAAPLLGVPAGCFVAHGRSNPKAICSAIRRAAEFVQARVHEKIRDRVAELHDEEQRVSALVTGGSGSRPGAPESVTR